MTKASSTIQTFDPNSAGTGDGIFGLPFKAADSKLILIPAPVEATTSYLGGTSRSPERIFKASQQVDLFHPLYRDVWQKGIAWNKSKTTAKISALNKSALSLVRRCRKLKGKPQKSAQEKANLACSQINELIGLEVRSALKANKIVGLVGGDHSTPFAAIAETLRHYPTMGILHLDAHFDLRRSYEGFTWSHASIFYNVMTRLPLKRLTQIGIRDYCDQEIDFASSHSAIKYFTDQNIFAQKSTGESWDNLCKQILSTLPDHVYLSFDIDGLDPALCPATGTPVPGGLSFAEIIYLLRALVASGRKVIGFDLVEVGPEEWDANVGARLLYEMCLSALVTQK